MALSEFEQKYNYLIAHGLPQELAQSVTALPGVSVAKARQLKKLGIGNIYELLRHFPRAYENWQTQQLISSLQATGKQEQVIVGRLVSPLRSVRKGKLTYIKSKIHDGTGFIEVVWFNQPWLEKQLKQGENYIFRGKVQSYAYKLNLMNPKVKPYHAEPVATESSGAATSLPAAATQVANQPIYALTANLPLVTMQRLLRNALHKYVSYMPEVLPKWMRNAYKLADSRFAYEQIHFPADDKMQRIAKRKLAFEELLLTQLALKTLRNNKRKQTAQALVLSKERAKTLKAFVASLPYTLTAGQQDAVKSILHDLSKTTAMNRLLQGDVGSGKTIVAAIAMLAAALSGMQAALMAPTVILAKQHYETLRTLLGPFIGAERIALVSGKLTAKAKKDLQLQLASGEVAILIGTNAVLSEKLPWNKLALAITDEQHRFGVNQRLRFMEDKDFCPHVLVMSATPIPRSLALVLYGDLDISLMTDKPAKRQEIMTYMAHYGKLHKVYEYLQAMLANGIQAYWICPLIEETENSEAVAATQRYEMLKAQFPDVRIGLVHGRLKEQEKQEVMQAFYARELDVLVATTVVEVGVDNPEANFMVIENAERFGLAQLHQLRGRVGRGEQRALCILLSDAAKPGSIAYERLLTLCRSQDGFFLANEDLKLRGPGDFFGTRQHGLPEFKIANLYEDKELIAETQAALQELLTNDKFLQKPEHRMLRQALKWYFPEWQETVVL